VSNGHRDPNPLANPLVSNGHLDTVLVKALAPEHVHVAKQHPLHLILPRATKRLSDCIVDSLPWIGGEPLFLIMIGNSDADHIIIEDRGCHVEVRVQRVLHRKLSWLRLTPSITCITHSIIKYLLFDRRTRSPHLTFAYSTGALGCFANITCG
jgi:hypothetical protein